ncbi:MAG: tetratricopeptide repeat protein [Alphaproteobacteria bacterium]|nr:tetratricopeptide repeat protein [Alphaproteobacteria bacterium]MBL0717821.1 tetratricopeptide repeat protein [Alphaproteobacteria bacterium]
MAIKHQTIIDNKEQFIKDNNNAGYKNLSMNLNSMALESFNRVIDSGLESADTYNGIGFVYRKEGNNEDALDNFNKAIELDTKLSYIYNNRGAIYMRIGEYKLALKDFDKAINLTPKSPRAYNNKGIMHIYKKNYKLALKLFSEVIKLSRSLIEANENSYRSRLVEMGIDKDVLSSGGFESEEHRLALITSNGRFYQLRSKLVEAHYNRGLTHMRNGNYKSAFKDFNKAVKSSPFFKEALYNRGLASMKNNKPKLALKDFNEGIMMNSSFEPALHGRGMIHMLMGRYSLASKDFEKFIEVSSKDNEYRYNNGLFHRSHDDNGLTDLYFDDNIKYIRDYLSDNRVKTFKGKKLNKDEIIIGLEKMRKELNQIKKKTAGYPKDYREM